MNAKSRSAPPEASEDTFTLLGVRHDGVASVVDLMPAGELPEARGRARWLLAEHASCRLIEVWRGGALLEQLVRC